MSMTKAEKMRVAELELNLALAPRVAELEALIRNFNEQCDWTFDAGSIRAHNDFLAEAQRIRAREVKA